MKEILCLKKNSNKYEFAGPFKRIKTCPNGPKVIFLLIKTYFWGKICAQSGPPQLRIVLVSFHFSKLRGACIFWLENIAERVLFLLEIKYPGLFREKKTDYINSLIVFFFNFLITLALYITNIKRLAMGCIQTQSQTNLDKNAYM